jgi:hypothetical protein
LGKVFVISHLYVQDDQKIFYSIERKAGSGSLTGGFYNEAVFRHVSPFYKKDKISSYKVNADPEPLLPFGFNLSKYPATKTVIPVGSDLAYRIEFKREGFDLIRLGI